MDEDRARPVTHMLSRIKDPEVRSRHPLKAYIAAFKDFTRLAVALLPSGSDTVNLRLDGGGVLKIGTRPLPPEVGQRSFDMPVLDRGSLQTPQGHAVFYYVQPEATPLPYEGYAAFLKRLAENGYRFVDPGLHQIGVYDGESRLLDPWSVERADA